MNEKFEIGKTYTVDSLEGISTLTERLCEFGFTSGESFVISHKLNLGGTLVIQIRDTSVALRENELKCIKIK